MHSRSKTIVDIMVGLGTDGELKYPSYENGNPEEPGSAGVFARRPKGGYDVRLLERPCVRSVPI